MLTLLPLTPTFGFGDRLALATPGHIAAVRAAGGKFAPVFVQQSVRENEQTRRTPQQVMDDAKRAVEALRVLATHAPDLFLKIHALGCERYEIDKRTYHVSAQLDHLPTSDDLPALLKNFHVRQMLHVTFGSALTRFGTELNEALVKYETAYLEGLQAHFKKHVRLLQVPA